MNHDRCCQVDDQYTSDVAVGLRLEMDSLSTAASKIQARAAASKIQARTGQFTGIVPNSTAKCNQLRKEVEDKVTVFAFLRNSQSAQALKRC
jgi:hypothetical protein